MNAALRGVVLLAVLTLAACAVPRPAPQPAAPGTVAGGISLTPLQDLAAVQRAADRIDQAQGPAERTQLLTAAAASAQHCLASAADNGACHYAQAQVLGLTARERPLQAVSLLKEMLASLTKAEALDPALDHAGPARLRAVVLLRAPPWPLGPGDVDAAVVAAQRAVQRDAAYPPNLLTLGVAQAKAIGGPEARATFAKARLAIEAWNSTADTPAQVAAERAQWQQELQQGLHDLQ
jgi:hypothetical protein